MDEMEEYWLVEANRKDDIDEGIVQLAPENRSD